MPTATAMTVEEMVAALRSIVDAAEGRPLDDAEVERYEQLEADLAVARRDHEIRSRQNAYETPIRTDLHVHAGGTAAVERTDEERAFAHYLRTGQVNSDLIENRAQSLGTDSAGGYTVPDGFLAKIVERRVSYGGIASLAETITTDSGNPLPFPTNDDSANSGEIVAENAAPAGGADLVFGVKTLGAYKYTSEGTGGLPLKVSVELLQDSAFDLESYIARKLGERIARKQATDFAVGTGTGQPQGLLTGLAVGVDIAAAVPTYAELLAATYVPDAQYTSDGAHWVMNQAILRGIQGIVDTSGRPLVADMTAGISGAPARTLLGYPVIIDNALPATWVAAAKTVIFGNVKDAYLIRQVKGVTLAVLRELYSVNFQVGFLAYARADALVQDAAAATVMSG